LSIAGGHQRIIGLRLVPKGLYRWYASCRNTPLGNTLRPAIPSIGILAQVFEDNAQTADELFGKPIAAVHSKYAIGAALAGSRRLELRLVGRALGKIIVWRLRGQGWPHPYFDGATGAPSHPITTLSQREREALRPLCGPHPAAGTAGR